MINLFIQNLKDKGTDDLDQMLDEFHHVRHLYETMPLYGRKLYEIEIRSIQIDIDKALQEIQKRLRTDPEP